MDAPAWTCSSCGCSLAEADQRRERLGLRGVTLQTRACTPDCERATTGRLYLRVDQDVKAAALADPEGARQALSDWARRRSSSRR